MRYVLVLVFVFVTSYGISFDSKLLIGFWKLVRSEDLASSEVYRPEKSVYYHFHSDKTVIMTDTYTRERSEWDWELKGVRLELVSQLDDRRIRGEVSFLSDGSLRYSVDSLGVSSYVWIFERLD